MLLYKTQHVNSQKGVHRCIDLLALIIAVYRMIGIQRDGLVDWKNDWLVDILYMGISLYEGFIEYRKQFMKDILYIGNS